jgi:hypothetical protein
MIGHIRSNKVQRSRFCAVLTAALFALVRSYIGAYDRMTPRSFFLDGCTTGSFERSRRKLRQTNNNGRGAQSAPDTFAECQEYRARSARPYGGTDRRVDLAVSHA